MKLIVSKSKIPSIKDTIFNTITEAISFSNTKDTIYIESGHYNEKIIINKELLDYHCNTIEDMERVNYFCKLKSFEKKLLK